MQFLPSKYKGEIYATLSGLLYGLVGYFGIQIINAGNNVGEMTFWRCAVSAVIAVAILLIKNQKIYFNSPAVIKIFIYGAIFYAPSSMLYFYSSICIGTGLAMVIFFIYPAMVVLINKILYKVDIGPVYYISIATIIGGMILLADLGESKFNLEGILLGVLSAFGYGAYIALCKSVDEVEPITSTLVVSLGCAFSGIIFSLVKYNTFSIPMEISTWIYIFKLALISTALPILLFLEAIKYISSTRASILGVLEPIFVIMVGVFFLNEKINFTQGIGVLIVLIGALIALTCKKDAA